MISSGLLVCSFYLKKKFSRGNDNVIDLNRKINDEENNSEYADIFELFNYFLNDASKTKDDERRKKIVSALRDTIINYDAER